MLRLTDTHAFVHADKGAAKGCGYQYPGAMIDVANQQMIVSYSIGKEDIALTVFPLASLSLTVRLTPCANCHAMVF